MSHKNTTKNKKEEIMSRQKENVQTHAHWAGPEGHLCSKMKETKDVETSVIQIRNTQELGDRTQGGISNVFISNEISNFKQRQGTHEQINRSGEIRKYREKGADSGDWKEGGKSLTGWCWPWPPQLHWLRWDHKFKASSGNLVRVRLKIKSQESWECCSVLKNPPGMYERP